MECPVHDVIHYGRRCTMQHPVLNCTCHMLGDSEDEDSEFDALTLLGGDLGDDSDIEDITILTIDDSIEDVVVEPIWPPLGAYSVADHHEGDEWLGESTLEHDEEWGTFTEKETASTRVRSSPKIFKLWDIAEKGTALTTDNISKIYRAVYADMPELINKPMNWRVCRDIMVEYYPNEHGPSKLTEIITNNEVTIDAVRHALRLAIRVGYKRLEVEMDELLGRCYAIQHNAQTVGRLHELVTFDSLVRGRSDKKGAYQTYIVMERRRDAARRSAGVTMQPGGALVDAGKVQKALSEVWGGRETEEDVIKQMESTEVPPDDVGDAMFEALMDESSEDAFDADEMLEGDELELDQLVGMCKKHVQRVRFSTTLGPPRGTAVELPLTPVKTPIPTTPGGAASGGTPGPTLTPKTPIPTTPGGTPGPTTPPIVDPHFQPEMLHVSPTLEIGKAIATLSVELSRVLRLERAIGAATQKTIAAAGGGDTSTRDDALTTLDTLKNKLEKELEKELKKELNKELKEALARYPNDLMPVDVSIMPQWMRDGRQAALREVYKMTKEVETMLRGTPLSIVQQFKRAAQLRAHAPPKWTAYARVKVPLTDEERAMRAFIPRLSDWMKQSTMNVQVESNMYTVLLDGDTEAIFNIVHDMEQHTHYRGYMRRFFNAWFSINFKGAASYVLWSVQLSNVVSLEGALMLEQEPSSLVSTSGICTHEFILAMRKRLTITNPSFALWSLERYMRNQRLSEPLRVLMLVHGRLLLSEEALLFCCEQADVAAMKRIASSASSAMTAAFRSGSLGTSSSELREPASWEREVLYRCVGTLRNCARDYYRCLFDMREWAMGTSQVECRAMYQEMLHVYGKVMRMDMHVAFPVAFTSFDEIDYRTMVSNIDNPLHDRVLQISRSVDTIVTTYMSHERDWGPHPQTQLEIDVMNARDPLFFNDEFYKNEAAVAHAKAKWEAAIEKAAEKREKAKVKAAEKREKAKVKAQGKRVRAAKRERKAKTVNTKAFLAQFGIKRRRK